MMHSLYGGLFNDPMAAVVLMDPSMQSTKDTTFTKIFVGGLPYHTTDKTLKEYFEQFGDIEEAVVITDRQTGKSRGYGFVTMKDRAGAEHACRDPNPIIDGRKANVNLAYLGAKPRNNAQFGLPFPLQAAAIPTLYQQAAAGRLGMHQLYYPASHLLAASPTGLVVPPSITQLSPTTAAASSQYFDYASTANATNAYDPMAYAAAFGVVPIAYNQQSRSSNHHGDKR